MSNTPQTKKGLGTFDFFCVGFGAIVGVGWPALAAPFPLPWAI